MALKEQQTPLMAAHNAYYKTVDGVTYFKLKSDFENDYTKHAGLLGEEIDGNFYFLRGYDLESAQVDENHNLIIQRVDKGYAPIVVKLWEDEEMQRPANPIFEYDRVNGVMTVTFDDGTVSKVGGFLVEGKDVRIATDSTFDGNGTIYNPLRLSLVESTGTYAPVEDYFDLTLEYNGQLSMPEGKGRGYRVITKEKIDNFGCLYPFSAVKRIQEKLDETLSPWRVATKEDWDDLLNSTETEEYRNHNETVCNWLGKTAGVALKSYNFWDNDNSTYGDSVRGQDIMGLSILPLGIIPDRNEVLGAINNDAEGYGKLTGIWANTNNAEGNAYVKLFGYNEGRVDQDTYGDGAKMSIRLVKEYEYGNYHEIENILGFPYPTELVYGPREDYPYVKIWTKINFYSDAENLGGVRSEEWEQVSDSDRGVKIIYYINEWDGEEWHKKPMIDGDSVVIHKYQTDENDVIRFHEWRVVDGVLVDTAEMLVEEFKKDFAEVKQEVAEIKASNEELVKFSAWTVNTIDTFSAATVENNLLVDNAIEKIDDDIHFVSGSVKNVSAITTFHINKINSNIAQVNETINAFSAATVENNRIVDEAIEKIDDDIHFVSGSVDTVSAITTFHINRIDNNITDEANTRHANDIAMGDYVLNRTEMTLPTNGTDEKITITIDGDFFNFGEF